MSEASVEKLFPGRPTARPTIYAYAETRPELAGLLKVGYTDRTVEERMAEHYPTKLPDGTLPYRVELIESAMRADGSCFMDHDVFRVLKARGFLCEGGEWYRCTADDVRAAVVARKELMEAPRRTVEPINKLSNDRPRILAFSDTVTRSSEIIAPEHELHIYGCNIPIDTSRPDEGIWLETRYRGRVATAEVTFSETGEAKCVFHDELPRSRYTLVLGTRCGRGTDFKVRRCLWDVRVA